MSSSRIVYFMQGIHLKEENRATFFLTCSFYLLLLALLDWVTAYYVPFSKAASEPCHEAALRQSWNVINVESHHFRYSTRSSTLSTLTAPILVTAQRGVYPCIPSMVPVIANKLEQFYRCTRILSDRVQSA